MEDKLFKIFDNINSWLHFAEAKNAVLTSFNGAAIFAVISMINSKDNMFNVCLLYVLLLLLLISLIISLSSFDPVLSKIYNYKIKIESPNILYYHHIANLTEYEYLKKVSEIITDKENNFNDFDKQLANQIINNSLIALQKMKSFKLALWFTIGGFVIFTVCLILMKISEVIK